MKRLIYIFAAVILILIALILIATRPVDSTPYFETDYYKQSQLQIDSLQETCIKIKDSLYAGFSKVSITPKLNKHAEDIAKDEFTEIPLAGYGDRKGAPAKGIHDSIFIKTAALKAGTELIVFISADLLIIPPDITDSVITLLREENISRDRLFFSATHTHSSLGAWAGGIMGKQFAGRENENLKRWLALKIAKAVTTAIDDLKPAGISSGNFNAGEFTRNRLVGDKGTKNDDFSYIYIEQTGHKKAVIGSFSAHSTTLGHDNMEISADYPGFWSRGMESTGLDYALFFAGAMGSQSPVSEGTGFEKARFLGEALAKRLSASMDTSISPEGQTVSWLSFNVPLPDYRFRITTKRTLNSYLSKNLMPHPGEACIQAVRLGEMIWITTPADFSGEYALMIRHMLAARGFESNITGFNGSYLGYIIPGRYFYLDKYEPKTMGWYGPAMGDYTMDIIRQLTDILTED